MSKHNIKIPPIGLTFSRDQMPQLGPKDGFLANLQKHKIKFHKVTIDSKDLKSSQGEFNKDAIASLMVDPKTSKSAIVISKDNYVLDGHHRWAANYNNDEKTDAIQVDLPILELIRVAKTFPTTKYRDILHITHSIKKVVKESIILWTYK